jgi:hypothetical protein|tara:strand:- start:784 stop:1158 length:375 start_codon:yes stop_codon:yes gene_type:complete
MFSLLGPVISGIFNIGKSYMDERKEVKMAKHTRLIKQIESDENIDTLNIQGGFNSWKDEFLTLVAITPMIMVFFPDLRPYAVEGFKVLSDTTLIPEWYLYLVSAVFAAGLGVKSLVGSIKHLKG